MSGKRRRGQLIPRGDRVGARVYIGGAYTWLGTFDTEAQAQAAIDQALRDGTGPSRETVAQFAERWTRDYPRQRASTNSTNAYNAKRIREASPLRVGDKLVRLGALPLRDVTRRIARAFILEHRYLLGSARAMFNDARDEELIEQNPFASLGLPTSRGRANIEPLTPAEVMTLADKALEVFEDEDLPHFAPMMRSAVLMAAYTCVRPGELFALERSDVDVRAGVLHVRRRAWKDTFETPKNHKAREIVLLDEARDAYLAIPPAAKVRPCPRCEPATCQRIFSSKRGHLFRQSSFLHYWHQLRSIFEAELPASRRRQLREARPRKGSLELYELRHTGASIMLDRGVAPADVAYQLGHADSQLVQRLYGHPSDAVTRERIRRAMGQNVRDLRSVEGEEAANG